MIHVENTRPFMPLGPHKGKTTWSYKANTDRFTMTPAECLLHRLISNYVRPMPRHRADILRFCTHIFTDIHAEKMREGKLNQSAKKWFSNGITLHHGVQMQHNVKFPGVVIWMGRDPPRVWWQCLETNVTSECWPYVVGWNTVWRHCVRISLCNSASLWVKASPTCLTGT